ncbi:hypothetical protein [Nocardia wallacei]|uniref:hypothetical protein n=1 Tax=Nocardia wallacei TaxID=480035 RepID=UPI002456FD2B|nr:hypothetical protein [Nocardia wallacei]
MDLEVSDSVEWDVARVRRLARRLGYVLIWPDYSPVRLVDHARAADVDVVVVPAPNHLGALEIDAVMQVADVETVCPRMSFSRWTVLGAGA